MAKTITKQQTNQPTKQVTGIYERFVAKRYLMDFHKFKDAALHMVRACVCFCVGGVTVGMI
jgi:hypothetical protein